MIGASICRLHLGHPLERAPLPGCNVGLVDGEYRHQPHRRRSARRADLTVTGGSAPIKMVAMIEAGANEVTDETML